METQTSSHLILCDGLSTLSTAFTAEDRQRLHLHGHLPAKIETLQEQTQRALETLHLFDRPLAKHIFLQNLRRSNQTLFYSLVLSNMSLICPLIYTPVVGEACKQFSTIFTAPEGLFLTYEDEPRLDEIFGRIQQDVSIIVVTDGSRILGLGDLGANGMGIPIGKLSLYIAGGGFNPNQTLPITLDVGTNTERYLQDPSYLGVRERRTTDQVKYYKFVDAFTKAVQRRWPRCLVQFEDFSNDHCFELLERHRNTLRCFNDDIQGTGSVIAAGFVSAMRETGIPFKDQKIVFYGAGSAGIGVADQIVRLMLALDPTLDFEQARSHFYFLDSRGLVSLARPTAAALESFKLPYARPLSENLVLSSLLDVVRHVRPTALIGLSGMGGSFTDEILKELYANCPKPIVFALSNPTANSECTAAAAYTATEGNCVFASGSPFDSVELNGRTYIPGQGNNMYIFPGLGFGAWLCGSSVVSDGMINAATKALADFPRDEGLIYPNLSRIREISASIAVAVMETAYSEGIATVERPPCLVQFVAENTYTPQ